MIALLISFAVSSVALALAVTALLSQRTKLIEDRNQHRKALRELYPMACRWEEQKPEVLRNGEDWRLTLARELIEADMEDELVQER